MFYNYAVWSTALALRVAHSCQQSTRSRKPYINSTAFRQVVSQSVASLGGGAYAGSPHPWIRAWSACDDKKDNLLSSVSTVTIVSRTLIVAPSINVQTYLLKHILIHWI